MCWNKRTEDKVSNNLEFQPDKFATELLEVISFHVLYLLNFNNNGLCSFLLICICYNRIIPEKCLIL
jgi:hypothetical protein